MTEIIFRVDGGNRFSVGMGHVYRCLKLADFLSVKRFKSVFVMRDIKGGITKVEEKGYKTIKLPEDIEKNEELNRLRALCNKKILITDIRTVDSHYFSILNNVCKKTVYFDDLGNNNYMPHILINPSISPDLQNYTSVNSSTKYFIGKEFFILNSLTFQQKEGVSEEIKKVLVSLGGADPANYTPSILNIIDLIEKEFEIILIPGPAFENLEEINCHVAKSSHRIEVLKNVNNMGELMYDADIAFVSGGDTALELAYTGTPGFIVPTIDYENITADFLEKEKVFVNLGDIKKRSLNKVLNDITSYWSDFEKRCLFSAAAIKFIDGRGLERVIDVIGLN